jgi:hypothetical protein
MAEAAICNSVTKDSEMKGLSGSLCPDLHAEVIDPGGVAAWPIEAGNEADFYRVSASDEDNRNRRRRRLGRERRGGAARCHDDSHTPANQLRRQRRQAIILALRQAIFDRDISIFDITGCTQPLVECG